MANGLFNLTSYGGFTGDPWWEARVVWTNTPDPATNTSTVSIVIQMRHTNGASFTGYYSGSYSFWNSSTGVEIVPYTEYDTVDLVTVGTDWMTVKTVFFTAEHDSSGNCIISPVVRANGAAMSGADDTYRQTDGTVTMELGSTKQKATLTNAPNFTDEENPTISYTNPMGNVVDKLEACITAPDGVTFYALYRDIPKTGTSYTFILTDAERATMRAAATSDTLKVRFYIRTTINGAKYLSWLTKTMTLAEINQGPTLTVSAQDINTTTVALTGSSSSMIVGYSAISYSINATPYKGSPIVSYEVQCGGQVKTTATGVFYNAESRNIICTARDARGNASTKTIVMAGIEDYVKVSCNQVARMLQESDTSAQVRVDLQGNFYNASFGAKQNDLKIEIRHGRNGEAMGDWVDISALLYTPSGNTYTAGTSISGLDPSGTYTFQSRVSDALTSATSGEYSVSFMPIFDWGQEDFNFNVPVMMNGETVLRHNAAVNNLVVSASGGHIYIRPGGTNNTTGEIKITPQGNIELSGDIIINGVSLTSKLGI